MGKTAGIKGQCLQCEHLVIGHNVRTGRGLCAYCCYNSGRLITRMYYGPCSNLFEAERKRQAEYDAIVDKLKNRLNPSWCPLRQEESQ